jgi:hypothetical protein
MERICDHCLPRHEQDKARQAPKVKRKKFAGNCEKRGNTQWAIVYCRSGSALNSNIKSFSLYSLRLLFFIS